MGGVRAWARGVDDGRGRATEKKSRFTIVLAQCTVKVSMYAFGSGIRASMN
jgi:hypothetical protein